MRGVFLHTHFYFFYFFIFFRGEFLLHIPCWLHSYVGSFSYTSHADFFMLGVSLTHPVLASFLYGEFLLHIPCWLHFYLGSFSYTSRAVLIFMQGICLSHPGTASVFHLGSFSYTSSAFFVVVVVVFVVAFSCFFSFFFFIGGGSLTHPVLASFLRGEFLWHIPFWLYLYLGSFSYTSRAGFFS